MPVNWSRCKDPCGCSGQVFGCVSDLLVAVCGAYIGFCTGSKIEILCVLFFFLRHRRSVGRHGRLGVVAALAPLLSLLGCVVPSVPVTYILMVCQLVSAASVKKAPNIPCTLGPLWAENPLALALGVALARTCFQTSP